MSASRVSAFPERRGPARCSAYPWRHATLAGSASSLRARLTGDTGEDHGTWDSWEEVAMCLAFARLSLDQVEVLVDQSPMQTLTSW